MFRSVPRANPPSDSDALYPPQILAGMQLLPPPDTAAATVVCMTAVFVQLIETEAYLLSAMPSDDKVWSSIDCLLKLTCNAKSSPSVLHPLTYLAEQKALVSFSSP
ncbi:unnamed protein product [Calypogeia fissa]